VIAPAGSRLTTSSALKTGSEPWRCANLTVLPAASVVTFFVASCARGATTPKALPYCCRNAYARSTGVFAVVVSGMVASFVARTKRATPVASAHRMLTLPPVAWRRRSAAANGD
jgi:hypothetical protein